jgi:ABC-type amino acid transport system permease subunit
MAMIFCIWTPVLRILRTKKAMYHAGDDAASNSRTLFIPDPHRNSDFSIAVTAMAVPVPVVIPVTVPVVITSAATIASTLPAVTRCHCRNMKHD